MDTLQVPDVAKIEDGGGNTGTGCYFALRPSR